MIKRVYITSGGKLMASEFSRITIFMRSIIVYLLKRVLNWKLINKKILPYDDFGTVKYDQSIEKAKSFKFYLSFQLGLERQKYWKRFA